MYTSYLIHESEEAVVETVNSFNNRSDLIHNLADILVPEDSFEYARHAALFYVDNLGYALVIK